MEWVPAMRLSTNGILNSDHLSYLPQATKKASQSCLGFDSSWETGSVDPNYGVCKSVRLSFVVDTLAFKQAARHMPLGKFQRYLSARRTAIGRGA